MASAPRIVLHGFTLSPPYRASVMTCEALGVEYETKFIDVTRLEHRQPAFLKLNPLHSIPTMEDGDYVLNDSHAISAYLCNMYGKDKADAWYPKEPRQRGLVDQRLHFNCSVLGPSFKNMAVPILFGKPTRPNLVAKVKESMEYLDKLLGDRQFIALDWPTIADCHCSSTAISVQTMVPDALSPRVAEWLQRCRNSLPGFQKVHSPAEEQMKALGTISSKL